MSIFSILRSTPEKRIQKLRKKVKEPHGDASVRIGAAQKLYELGSPEALRALLDRFTINVSPSTQDEQEKEDVLSWLISLGEQAVAPIIHYLKSERQVYWPVRALKEILPPDRLAHELNQVLRYHWEYPPADPAPKAQLLQALEGIHSEALEATIRLLLQDASDEVRLAALDYLFRRQEKDARESVLQCYLEAEDRPRIRMHILEQMSDKSWSVRGFRPTIEATLPAGYSLTREGIVKRVGGTSSD